MLFKEIPGNDLVKKKLIDGVQQNRIAHAQLFLGAPGTANLPLALAYTQYVNCLNPLEDDSCGECSSCLKFKQLVHPDLHFSFPIKGAQLTSDDFVQQFRSKILSNPYLSTHHWMEDLGNENSKPNISALECRNIIRKLGFKPYEAKIKVLIMWMPEFMGKEGNILLKLIEEPKGNALIILCGQDENKMLGTILSRVQISRVPYFEDQDLIEYLSSERQVSVEKAQQIALLSQGNMSKALDLIEHAENAYFEDFRAWMLDCYKGEMSKITAWVTQLSALGRESLKAFIEYGLQICRACLVNDYDLNTGRLTSNEEEFVHKLSRLLDLERISHFYDLLNKAHYGISRNGNAKVLINHLSLDIHACLK